MIKGIELDDGKRVKLEDFDKIEYDLPKSIFETIKPYNNTIYNFNSYSIGDINNCLRRTYWDRVEGHYEKLSDLIRSAFGKSVHAFFLDKFDVKEKKVKLEFQIGEENIIIVGKFDAYDFETKTLIDLKTVNDATKNYLPKIKDIYQLQYFWTLVDKTLPAMKIEKLQIVYVDRNGNHKVVTIYKENRLEELKNRSKILHLALKNRIPPHEEETYYCNYCPFNQKCDLNKLGIKNKNYVNREVEIIV